MELSEPFTLSIQNPKPNLRELHIDFTPAFRELSIDERLENLRVYVQALIQQSESLQDPDAQRGVIMMIEIVEQILPHVQSDSLPLEQTLIVEMGEGGEGSSLNELLS